MLLVPEVVATLLATFTATHISDKCRIARKFVRSIWIALPLGGNDGPKGSYVQPKLSLVQVPGIACMPYLLFQGLHTTPQVVVHAACAEPFGEQGIFRTLEGTEALQNVSAGLLIVVTNIFAYGILCLGMERQPDPIPAALVCIVCAGKLWLLLLKLLRTNLIYRYEAFQRLLPLVLIMAGALAAVLSVSELPLHRHLEFGILRERLRAVKLQWAAEVETLVIPCFWLLLWAAASSPAVEEVEGLKESLRKPTECFHPRLWKCLEGAAPTLDTDSASSACWTVALLLMVPPIFSLASSFIDRNFLWWARTLLAAAALILRVASAKDLVQASLLRQSTDLASLLDSDSGGIKTEEQKKALLKASRCVALANRTTATRMAEVLLSPTILLLLLGAYTLVCCSSGLAIPPPPELISRLGAGEAAASLQAMAVSRAAAACTGLVGTCEGCCTKTSMLQEVLCPLVSEHFESLREERGVASAAKLQGDDAKARPGSLIGWGVGGASQPTAFEFECLSGAAAAAAQLGPTGSAWRPLLWLLFGTPQQRKDAMQLFTSLSHSDAVKWFRYSFGAPPFLSTELLLFLQNLFFLQLFAASFAVTLLEAISALRIRRQGPSVFSIWGPEVPAPKSN